MHSGQGHFTWWQKSGKRINLPLVKGKKLRRESIAKGLWHQMLLQLMQPKNRNSQELLIKNYPIFIWPFFHSYRCSIRNTQASRTEKVDKLGYRFICHCLWLCYDHVSFWRQFMCAIIINAFIKPKRTETTHWKRKESRNKWAECP